MNVLIKISLVQLALVLGFTTVNAQNLLNLDGWNLGSTGTDMFILNGAAAENIREWGEGPGGKRVLLWKGSPDGNGEGDGGWNSSLVPIDHAKMYRYSVWLKKINSNDGTSYFGCQTVLSLSGAVNDNPYFWYGDLPELNRWYLMVGYVHGSSDASLENFGGIYDGVTGAKVTAITDFKFVAATTHGRHRSYLYYDANTSDRQFFYAPRMELVNGNEPNISALLGISFAETAQTYFSGNVGIKTANPGNYELAVNGKIRAREIKVENSNWPDYVFKPSYRLPSLDSTRIFILKNGHLPGVPSAKEVEKNGFNISEMNGSLLRKIEELTLHLLKKDQELQSQNARITAMENRQRKTKFLKKKLKK